MFIGYRGTVRAGPIMRGSASRDRSGAMVWMPDWVSAGARLGLSVGICGSLLRPECSPVTTSVASMLTWLFLAQVTLSVICCAISCWVRHWVLPAASLVHCHGTTEKFW